MTENDQPKSLTDVVDELKDKASEDGDLSVEESLDEFAGRLFGPLLLLPGLVTVSPLGGIPTVPTMMGVFVILVMGQSLLGFDHPWLPGIIANRNVSEKKFRDSMEKFRPWLEWIDKFTAQRMQGLVRGPMKYVIALVAIAMACTMPPLEVVPFACAIPGAAILLLGLAITARDGLLALGGLVASLAALGTVAWWFLG
jgi:hypothetical protein